MAKTKTPQQGQKGTGKTKARKKHSFSINKTRLLQEAFSRSCLVWAADSGIRTEKAIPLNFQSHRFLKDIYDKYDCQQIVIELKNVKELDREHINQVNRYLKEQFGRFGIILTRKSPSKQIFKNTIDLWSGQRKCILILCDEDLKMMCQLFKSRQRLPIDVIKKKFAEFNRACPG